MNEPSEIELATVITKIDNLHNENGMLKALLGKKTEENKVLQDINAEYIIKMSEQRKQIDYLKSARYDIAFGLIEILQTIPSHKETAGKIWAGLIKKWEEEII